MSDNPPGSLLPAKGIPNLRDIGGYTTTDGGTVRRGLVYRSTTLDHATDADVQLLADRGIRSVIDLRTAAEREARPDRLPEGVDVLDLDVFADSPGATPARIAKLSSEPEKATRLLARADVDAVFAQAYRGLVSLPSALGAFRQLFLTLSRSDTLPALYHCTTGKDRTGWATAALLLVLGVPEQTVVDDYVLSNDYLLASLKPVLDAFAARGGDPEKLKPVLGVKAQYLLTAFEELQEKYGTIERYFADGLGLDSDAQQRLKDIFLE